MDGDDVLAASADDGYRLRTAASGKFSFLAFGDSGSGSPEELALVSRMAAEPNVSFVMHTGDLAYDRGTFAQYESSYFGTNASLMARLPFFPTPGNHEYMTESAAPYLAFHAVPDSGVPEDDRGRYYSFDWGNAHFTTLDSNLLPTNAADRMLNWVDQDLAATRKFWKIVYFHHPPYPSGHHIADMICAQVRDRVVALLERNGVQLVISGHEHGYERSLPLRNGAAADAGETTLYLITGGGGAGLHEVGRVPQTALTVQAHHYLRVEVDGGQLMVRATGLDGSQIDNVLLAPQPALAANGVVNAGDFTPALAPGGLASLFGRNLAPVEISTPSLPLPTELGGVRVRIGGVDAPLLYVSPTQINFQLPYNLRGAVTVRVTTPNGFDSAPAVVAEAAPAILAVVWGGRRVSAAQPVDTGALLTIYLTGLGAVRGDISAGEGAPSRPLPTAASVNVRIGNRVVQPSFAGLAPGFSGLYQVNLTVPPDMAPGSYPLRVVTAGISSQSATLTLQLGNQQPNAH